MEDAKLETGMTSLKLSKSLIDFLTSEYYLFMLIISGSLHLIFFKKTQINSFWDRPRSLANRPK